jgi:hypothetical protein
MMVSVVRRAIRMTQPPPNEVRTTQPQAKRDGAWLEEHYALLVTAGY